MKNIRLFSFALTGVLCVSLSAFGQPTPTPTPAEFKPCTFTGVDKETLIRNGDFEGLGSWFTAGGSGGQIVKQTLQMDAADPTTKVVNHYMSLKPGSAVYTIPSVDSSQRNNYNLSFCGMIANGKIIINIGTRRKVEPVSYAASYGPTIFKVLSVNLDLSSADMAKANPIKIEFEGTPGQSVSYAYIDNVELLPDYGGGEEPTEAPTVEPTPPATPTPSGPSPTPTPSLMPGSPTPTPTPGLRADSVQLIANPPMLLVSPDDFAANSRIKKQSEISWQIIGTNGEPIDIAAMDPEAQIRFIIQNQGDQEQAGTIVERTSPSTTDDIQTQWTKVSDLQDPVSFIPLKVFDGTVRIAAELKFKSHVEGRPLQHEIRGVVPIVIRTNPNLSSTDVTGSFKATQNQNRGRKPGDRGFRPDAQTNLYFRELYE